jgi:hypothetical protein
MVDKNTLGWWLSERQVSNGGLNGRPEKLEDVGFEQSELRQNPISSLTVFCVGLNGFPRSVTPGGPLLLWSSSAKLNGLTDQNLPHSSCPVKLSSSDSPSYFF